MCSTHSLTHGCTVQAYVTAVGLSGLLYIPIKSTKINVPHLCWSLSMVLYGICYVPSPRGIYPPTTLPEPFLILCSQSPLLECNHYSLHPLQGVGVGLHLPVDHLLCGICYTATKGMLSLPSSYGGYSPGLFVIPTRSTRMDTDFSVPSLRMVWCACTLPSPSCPYPSVIMDYSLALDSAPNWIFLLPFGLIPTPFHWLATWIPAHIDPISLNE